MLHRHSSPSCEHAVSSVMQQDCCFLREVTDAVGLRYSRPLHVLRKEREKIVKSRYNVWRFSLNACMLDGFALFRAFFLLLGIPEEACSGVFIAENAHRYGNPTLHPQEECSSGRQLQRDIGREADFSAPFGRYEMTNKKQSLPLYGCCEMERRLPSGSLNQATFAPSGEVHIPMPSC